MGMFIVVNIDWLLNFVGCSKLDKFDVKTLSIELGKSSFRELCTEIGCRLMKLSCFLQPCLILPETTNCLKHLTTVQYNCSKL